MATVDRLGADLAAMKPRLRGWLHAAMVPVTVVSGVVLVARAQGTAATVASAVFILTALVMFTVSAAYHTGRWTDRTRLRLKRWDHANIFVLIAGSYTAFSVLMLPPEAARTLSGVVWTGALLGVGFQLFWVHAPRWLYVPIYVALGWAAVFWAGDFAAADRPVVLTLVVLGGLLYTVGAVAYGTKRPDPAPAWFGFHEVFHAFTIAAFAAHAVGVALLL